MTDLHTTLAGLLELAESLGISVRMVSGRADPSAAAGGALVRLRDKEMILLERDASPADQVAAVAAALHGREELDDMFLMPDLRELIDSSDDSESQD